VLLRLAYLGMTNVFALLRLLPMSSRDKDAEILALRHQFRVLQRQPGPGRVRFTPADRALLAALLHRLRAIHRRDERSLAVTRGHPDRQVRPCGRPNRTASRADSAGWIPVTRST
jgi:hypothetical protein